MSKEKTPDAGGAKFPFREATIFIAWIATLLVLAGIFWAFTLPARNNLLVKSVNRALEESGDSRRLETLSNNERTVSFGMSARFAVKNTPEQQSAVVFTLIGEGTFFPCVALLNQDGKVAEFIPLNRHGERVMRRISPGLLKIFSGRIEGNKQ